MSPQQSNVPGSDELKESLRKVFDSQIPNYGDYNLVFAINERHEKNDAEGQRTIAPRYYVIGYRWQPAELMVAPVNGASLTGGGVPVEVNMTNLSHAVLLAGGDYEVGTSTGKTFRFGVRPEATLSSASGTQLVIDQTDDFPDFKSFMTAFVRMARA